MLVIMKEQNEEEGNQKLQINKGIEFMLRRRVDKVKPKHGLTLSKTFNLLRRTYHFNMEFSWEVDKPNKE
jgi:hypothetical protein